MAAVLLVGLLAAACGGGSDDSSATGAPESQAEAPESQADASQADAPSDEGGAGAEPEPAEVVVRDDPFAAIETWRGEQVPGFTADCQGGDLFACDFLWYAAKSASDEFQIALSCGGTREATANSRCVGDDLEPITEGDHPLLDEFTASCRDGDLDGCFRLRLLVSGASAYYDFAEICIDEIDDGAASCSAEMFEDGLGR